MKTDQLVPLGPNVTRDGRKARVICNDRENGLPVIVLLKTNSGPEVVSHHFADGTVNLDGTDGPSDLVGHLPPKPREFWVAFDENGNPFSPKDTPVSVKSHLFREVLPGADDELEKLRGWKRDAMKVLDGLQLQEIGTELGLTLGTDIGPQILPAIRQYLALLERAHKETSLTLANDILDAIRP